MSVAQSGKRARRPGFGRCMLSILLVFVAILQAGSASAAGKALFTESNNLIPAGPQLRRADLRSRGVRIDVASIAGADLPFGAESVGLNLFPDVDLVAARSRFERRDEQHFTWYGQVPGDPLSMVILVAGEGLVSGSVFAHGRHYAIRGSDADSQQVVEIDQAAFRREACDGIPENPLQPEVLLTPDSRADSGATIEVMVVYTPAARSAEGGTAAIENLITLAVAETNTSYGNSGVAPRLALVHAAEVSYVESGFYSLDLSRLQTPGDGYMDEVHALRDTYGADAVVLLFNNIQICGIASAIMATESSAFALVAYDCATANYSFGHELGHLQGARHDWFVDATNNSPFSYNHGDIDLTIRQRTMMSYNDQCTATFPFTSCTRVPYWSNPGVNYPSTTRPAGSTIENNAMALNTTAATVANFRQAAVPRFTLTVQSVNPATGVPVTVTPADTTGLGDGTTAFTRTYASGAAVTLTAPTVAAGNRFASWSGCTSTSGTDNSVCAVTMDAAKTVVATYSSSGSLTVESTYPAVGTSITVAPADNNGQGSGTTVFTRRYAEGTAVTLTAPLTADGNPFAGWSGCDSTSGAGNEVCSVTMAVSRTVVASYTRDTVARPTAFALFTRSDTGRAAIWEVDPGTGTLQNAVWLYGGKAIGAPWLATSYQRVDASTGYVLWTRSDTGRAVLWRIDPATGEVTAATSIHSTSGIGSPWQATSYAHIDAATGYVLWTRSDSGRAVLWKVDPSSGALLHSVSLHSATGIGAPWQATGFSYAGETTGYVLWTRSDTGQAVVWTVDPATGVRTGVLNLYPASGVGASYQATGFELEGPTTGRVLWTRADTGRTVVWTIDPTLPGTDAAQITSSTVLYPGSATNYPAGLAGGPWQATSFVPPNAAPTVNAIANVSIDEDAVGATVSLTGISSGAGDSQTISVTATSSNHALIADPTVSYTSPGTTGTLTLAPVANASGTATITVWISDGQAANSPFSVSFTVTLLPVNDAPTDIALSSSLVDSGLPAGTAVGAFSTTDPDGQTSFTYALVPGAGDTDNALFTIGGTGGADLQTSAVLDYAGGPTYSIRVQSSDGLSSTEKAFTLTRPAYALWSRTDTGQAQLWQVDPATGARRAAVSLPALGAPWQATSFARVDGANGFVLWSRSDTGQALLAQVNPNTGAATRSVWLGNAGGVGSPWQATSFVRADAAVGYVLWSRHDVGRAVLWEVDLSGFDTATTLAASRGVSLQTATGVGAPWLATSFARVDATSGYLLWGRSDLGRASLWRMDLTNFDVLSVLPIDVAAPVSSAGAPWLAAGYEHAGANEGYVLWTRGDAGWASLWRVDPVAMPSTLSALSSMKLHTGSELGAPWQATSYVRP